MKPNVPQYNNPIPITENHRKYHRLCKDPMKRIVLASGWAGTGKTIVAAYYAAQAINRKQCKGVVLVRSLEGVGKNPGAYPGTAFEKNEPKLRQLMNYISTYTGRDAESLIYSEELKVCGLYDIQGMDFTGYWLVVTEAQTLTAEQMYQICTRGAEKIIIDGDVTRSQLTNHSIKIGKDGLSFLISTLGDLDIVGKVHMEADDIVRQDYIKEVILRTMPALEIWK